MSTDVQVTGLKELNVLGCRLGWDFYHSRCNSFCFCTNYKYERDRKLGDRLDSDQLRGGNGLSQVCSTSCHALKVFTPDEVVTRFRLRINTQTRKGYLECNCQNISSKYAT